MDPFYLAVILATVSLLASLDPFVISVFTALLLGSRGQGHNSKQRLLIAILYAFTYFLLISLFGLGLVGLLSQMSSDLFTVVAIAVALLAIIWGLLERIKNYFWYKPLRTIPKFLQNILHQRTMKNITPISTVSLTVYTALASLIHTAVIISSIAVLVVLLKPGNTAWPFIVGAVMILPLMLIYVYSHRGLRLSAIIHWKENNKKTLELSLGLLSVYLGWLILLGISEVFSGL